MNPFLVALLSFAVTAGTVSAVLETRARSARQVQARLHRVSNRFVFAPPPEPNDESGIRPDTLPTVTRWLGRGDLEPRLRLAMLQADLRLRPAEWIALCISMLIGGGLLGILATHQLVTGLLLGAVCLAVPLSLLAARREARRRRFDGQLPEALLLLTSALRAGFSFSLAMQTLADDLPSPLAEEFAWASGEVNLGVPLETALGRIGSRVQSPDFDLVVTAILIQLPLGGNLAEVLETIAETIRERVRVTGEVQTLTAEGRLSAGILILLAPALALLLHLRNPEYFQPLMDSPSGHILIAGAILGQVLGGFVIHRMVSLAV